MTRPARRLEVVGAPGADEIRAALARVLASDVFRGSPQLAAFLSYVVGATLRGEADRLKGYTIAIEALGRDHTFDPQADPIVRVEAARLRRAIARYYAGAGSCEPVLMELPLGSYAPVFRRVPAPPRTAQRVSFNLPRLDWRRVASGAALVLIGACAYAALDVWFDFHSPRPYAAHGLVTLPVRAPADAARDDAMLPVVLVEPIEAVGTGAATAAIALSLGGKLRDALARFDEIQVITERPAASGERARVTARAGYRLAASLETYDDGTLSLTVRLIDAGDASVDYARAFHRVPWSGDLAAAEDAIVRELSAALAQPYGIIHANARAKLAGSGRGGAHYRCLMQAYDYWRDYDPVRHARVRECLEQTGATDSSFAVGFAALASIVLEEYRSGVNLRPADAPPLQRALQAARRAVALKPGSARAHQALLDVHFARGDYAQALEAGERAMMLNPYDPDIIADYGARLVSLGEREKGARLLRQAAASIVARPAWHDFFLFLVAWLADDESGAARHVALINSDTYPLGLVARLLVATGPGDNELRRQLIDRLVALQPGWRDDPQGELKKIFPSVAIVARVSGALARAGLGATN